jgi:hypothetical protein
MSDHTTHPPAPDPAPMPAPAQDTGFDDVPARTVRVGYLVMGLIFLGIAGIWALNASGTVDWGDSKYAFPAVLVGAGVLGLAATLAANATRRPRAHDEGHNQVQEHEPDHDRDHEETDR